jgi:uncharacterized protein
MRFFVSEIRNTGHIERSAKLDPRLVLGSPPEYVAFQYPLDVSVKCSLSTSDVVISGQISTRIGFVCARCLENFERAVSLDFQQVFGLDLEEFDVTEDIREAVYIDLPLTPICREGCLGLCPMCGKNRNQSDCSCKPADSRSKTGFKWDILKEFRSQSKRS